MKKASGAYSFSIFLPKFQQLSTGYEQTLGRWMDDPLHGTQMRTLVNVTENVIYSMNSGVHTVNSDLPAVCRIVVVSVVLLFVVSYVVGVGVELFLFVSCVIVVNVVLLLSYVIVVGAVLFLLLVSCCFFVLLVSYCLCCWFCVVVVFYRARSSF